MEQAKTDEADSLQFLEKQCEDYKRQVEELTERGQASLEIQKSVGKLREELKIQEAKWADDRRALEQERKNGQELGSRCEELKGQLTEARDRLDADQDSFEVCSVSK